MAKVRLAVALALLAAGMLTRPALAEDLVRLGNLKFAHYGAISYMKEIGVRYGLKIEERVFPKGIDIIPAIITGEIDVAASALDAAIAGRAAGVPAYVVAGFARGGARIVARTGGGIARMSDLKGRKIGVTRGGTQETLLLAELARHALSWSDKPGKDVQIVYMGYADLNQALIAGTIDAMSHSEPQASQAINKGFGVEIVKPYDTEMGEPVRSLVMTEKLYREKPDVAQRVLDCFVAATAAFIANPELAERYVRESMFKGQISHEDYVDAIGNSPFTYDITLAHVQVNTDMMQKYGVGRMTNPPRAEDWVRLDLLQKAKAAAKVQ